MEIIEFEGKKYVALEDVKKLEENEIDFLKKKWQQELKKEFCSTNQVCKESGFPCVHCKGVDKVLGGE